MTGKWNVKKAAFWLAGVMTASFVLAGGIFYMTGGFHLEDYPNKYGVDVNESREITLAGKEEIKIEAVSAKVHLTQSENSAVLVRYYGKSYIANRSAEPRLVVEERGNTLVIRDEPATRWANFNGNMQMDIAVPQEFRGKLGVTTVSGDIDASRLNASAMFFHTVSGDVGADGLQPDQTIAETTSGNINLSGLAGNLQAASVSGGIKAAFSDTGGSISANTTSGDVVIALPGEAGFNLDVQSVSGHIESEFSVAVNALLKGKIFQGLVGNGSGNLSIKTISGDVSILKQ